MTVKLEQSKTLSAQATAERELGRFFAMAVDGVPNLTMFSEYVDGLWHELLTDQAKYRAFCETLGLPVLQHLPLRGSGPVDWVAAYESRYGKLPDVWFMDAGGALDENLRDRYHSEGTITCSWDCTVIHGTE